MSIPHRRRSQASRFALVLLAVGVATGLRLALRPVLGDRQPMIVFYFAVLVASRFGGLRPTALAVVLSVVLGLWLFLPDWGSSRAAAASNLLSLVSFLLFCGVVLAFGEANRRALARLEGEVEERELAERQVREAEARVRLLLDSTGEAIFGVDRDGLCTFANPACIELLGYRGVSELLGRPMHALLHPDHAEGGTGPSTECRLGPAFRDGSGVVIDGEQWARADGSRFLAECRSNPIVVEGRAVGSVVAFADITDRRRGESMVAEQVRLVEFGREISSALASGDRLSEMLGRCVEATVRHLDSAFARIWTVDPTGQTLELQASAGLYTHLDGAHASVPVGRFKIGMIARERRPHLTNAVIGDPRVPEQEWARREGMVAFAGYPLTAGDRVVGVMAAFSRSPMPDGSLRMMATVADEIAVAIERKQSEARHHRQQEWLRVTLASIGDAVIATDTSGDVTFLNAVAEQLTGWPLAEAAGRPLAEVFRIIHEGTRRPVEDPAARAIREGAIVGLPNHTTLIARDGAEHAIDDSAAPIRDAQGAVGGAVLVFRDVTEARSADRLRRIGEDRFRALVAASAQIVWVTQPDGTVAADSPSWRGFTGQTYEQWRGDGWLDAVHPDDRDRAAEAWARATRERIVYDVEYRLRRRDGVHRWMSTRGVAIANLDGSVREWVGMNFDIHDRREAEESARLSELQFRTLADSIPQLAWTARPDGHIGWYNRRWYEYTGTSPEDMLGWGWRSVHDPAELPRIMDRFRAHLASGEPWEDTFPLRRHDGQMRWHLSRALPVRDESGRIVCWFGTNTDITERRQIEEELRAAKDDAEQANEAKSRFLAVLSHELRTPLNPILLATSAMLERPADPDELRATLEMIRQNVNLQARLIDDLLDVMRIVRGKMPLHWEVADCHRLIDQAAQICRSELFGRSHRLELDLKAAHPLVNADPARLQQVFWNLIKNAVKFTPEGGSIAIRTHDEPGEDGHGLVAIEVADTGIGIDAEVIPRIFDPFQQGETTITRRFGGLGLGLAICKGIVEAHGGELSVSSPGPGLGTTFRFALPALPAPAGPAVEAEGEPDEAPQVRGWDYPSSLRILVVEDEPATLRLLARLLRKLGHEVTTADTIEAGTQAIEDRPVDLIISDIGLPDGSGLELIRRAVRRTGGVPAIALTGYGMEEDVRRSREAGFTAHLTKPIDFTKLEAMIQQVAPIRPA